MTARSRRVFSWISQPDDNDSGLWWGFERVDAANVPVEIIAVDWISPPGVADNDDRRI